MLHCKTVGFSSKSVKKSEKAWRESLTREAREQHTPVGLVRGEQKTVSPQSRSLFSASFQTFCLTVRASLNLQKYRLFCSLYLAIITHR